MWAGLASDDLCLRFEHSQALHPLSIRLGRLIRGNAHVDDRAMKDMSCGRPEQHVIRSLTRYVSSAVVRQSLNENHDFLQV